MQLPWPSAVALLWLEDGAPSLVLWGRSPPPLEAGPCQRPVGEFWSLWAARKQDPSP